MAVVLIVIAAVLAVVAYRVWLLHTDALRDSDTPLGRLVRGRGLGRRPGPIRDARRRSDGRSV